MNKPKLIMVSAPSGAGKSSFVERLCEELPIIVDVVTHTARPPRQGERDGQPYHFVSSERFELLIKENFFVEYARVHGTWYGTSHAELEKIWTEGKWGIMDVDVQGAITFRMKFPGSTSIFIHPPSLEVLRERILSRGKGVAPSDLELRLKNAEIEMKRAVDFDYELVNDEFESSYQNFKKIVEVILSGH